MTSYNCTSLTYPNGTAVDINVANKLVIKSVKSNALTIDVQFKTYNDALVKEYIGSRTFKLQCTAGDEHIYPHVRYNIDPISADHLSMTSDEYDTPATCSTPIFPIYYGGSSDVTINHFGPDFDSTGMIIAG